jgi:hypothetical protein
MRGFVGASLLLMMLLQGFSCYEGHEGQPS